MLHCKVSEYLWVFVTYWDNKFLFCTIARIETNTMQSTAKTVEEYLQELPGDRKIAMAKLRKPFLQIFP